MKDKIDLGRIKNLLIYKTPELIRHISYFLLIQAIICLVIIIGSLEVGPMFAPAGKVWVFLTIVLIAVAPVLFEKEKNIHNSVFDFILPVSSEERFFYYWLKYVVIVPAVCILFLVLAKYSFGIMDWAGAAGISEYMVIGEKVGENIFKILGIQSLFFCALFVFRRKFFIKTAFVLFLYMLFTLLISGLIFSSFVFGSGIPEVGELFHSRPRINSAIPGWVEAVMTAGEYIYAFIFPVGLWIVSYLYIKEKEI